MTGRSGRPSGLAGLLAALLFCSPVLADYQAGLDASDVGDYTTAFAEFARAAAQGDLRAANALGELYERGDGVARDPVRAGQWYRRAADAGNREAQYNLAGMYRGGDGLPLDEALSMQWYARAAAQGLPIAQFFVGKNYEHGQGTAQDMAEAWAWYSLAAAGGDDGSARNRDRIAKFLDETQQQRAVTLLRDHALELALAPSALRELGVTPPETGVGAAADNDAAAGPGTVSAIQRALAELGYEVGVVDGVAGPRTRQALSEFATTAGMEGDPRIGARLLEQLRAALSARGEAAREFGDPGAAAEEQTPSPAPAQPMPEESGRADAVAVADGAGDVPPIPVPARADELGPTPATAAEADEREQLRQRLRALGYRPLETQEAERSAVAAFARDAGLDTARIETPGLMTRMDILMPFAGDTLTGGELVQAVQTELGRLGHDAGTADGIVGARTRSAIAAFAAAADFPVLPSVTPLFLARLRMQSDASAPRAWADPDDSASPPVPEVSLAAPSTGAVELQGAAVTVSPAADGPLLEGAALVRAVQTGLEELGYEPGPVDGVAGVRTRNAAAGFRADRGLPGGSLIDTALFGQLRAIGTASLPPGTAAVAIDPSAPGVGEAATDPVRETQAMLATLGFDVGEADGIAGPRTRGAVLAFERAHGFPALGSIDATLLSRLREAASVGATPGMDATTVREARRQLLARGYSPGSTDGQTGALLNSALTAFQRDQGMTVSGELDASTLSRLRSPPEAVRVGVTLLREVQAALGERGFDAGPADGAMGPRTRAALTAFRRAQGLPAGADLDRAVLRRLGLAESL